MRIEIAQRLKPFSHTPGTSCIVPGTPWRVQIYPAMIRVDDLSGGNPVPCGEIPLPVQGPVKGFTVVLDLEKGRVQVFGEGAQGYFRYHLIGAKGIGLKLVPEKGAMGPDEWKLDDAWIAACRLSSRLFLGCSKQLDWTMVRRRQDLAEILPVWHRLGQYHSLLWREVPINPSLLELCKDSRDPYKAFLDVWNAGFEGMLSPRTVDTQYQGYPEKPLPLGCPAMALLTQGRYLIEDLFFRQEATKISLLPNLPPQFHCGRMTGVLLDGIGILDFEWSKKTLRRMSLRVHPENLLMQNKVLFRIPADLKTMRLTLKEKSWRLSPSSPIDIHPGERYLLDRFEH